jgi:FixJ family two-component response regulator
MSPTEPTVFVVDDDAAICRSIAILLGSVRRAAETFASAGDFLEAYDPDRPGCLVLDVRMPGMSGLELQKRLESRGSTLPVIFLTAHGDVPMAVEAIQTGAVDFVQKPFRDQELLDKIEHAIEEDARRRESRAEHDDVTARIDSLSPRERQVLEMVTDGHANKVIAAELGVCQRTVEIHRAHVMRKMRAHSLAELVQTTLAVKD